MTTKNRNDNGLTVLYALGPIGFVLVVASLLGLVLALHYLGVASTSPLALGAVVGVVVGVSLVVASLLEVWFTIPVYQPKNRGKKEAEKG